jgi:propionyl-CoA carboxylase alpha chain
VFVNTELGQLDLTEAARFPEAKHVAKPGSLESPLPGRVIRVLAEAGATVEAGQPLLIVEAMKMEHEIVAPTAGPLVELRVTEGQQVETGTVLAVIGSAG